MLIAKSRHAGAPHPPFRCHLAQHPAGIVVAVPIAAASSCGSFNRPGEGIVCVCEKALEPFYAVGFWYEEFDHTTDEEVCKLLKQAQGMAKTKA